MPQGYNNKQNKNVPHGTKTNFCFLVAEENKMRESERNLIEALERNSGFVFDEGETIHFCFAHDEGFHDVSESCTREEVFIRANRLPRLMAHFRRGTIVSDVCVDDGTLHVHITRDAFDEFHAREGVEPMGDFD